MRDVQLTIWNEFRHEQEDSDKGALIRTIYPEGIHMALAKHFSSQQGIAVRTATLDEPEHGLTQDVLEKTDVLLWWGHKAHAQVQDDIVDRVQQKILQGMGLIVLHSGHFSKIFQRMMGTSGNLRWREDGKRERLWVVNPCHPITSGIGPYIELAEAEMYGEYFDIPEPEALLFVSWFEGGEIFRSGCVWSRGKGKIFYFRPGHETYPIFYHPEILQILTNAVHWAKFSGSDRVQNRCFHAAPPDPR